MKSVCYWPAVRAIVILVFLGTASSSAIAQNFEVDSAHSSVMFRIKHSDISYIYGMFKEVSGTFTHGTSGNFNVTVAADSIETGNAGRDRHLKSPDFFSARQFPTIRFKSTKITPDGDDKFNVTGQLTLHGITKSVQVEVRNTGLGQGRRGEPRGGIEANFRVKRSDFKLGGAAGLEDEVRLFVSLQGVEQ